MLRLKPLILLISMLVSGMAMGQRVDSGTAAKPVLLLSLKNKYFISEYYRYLGDSLADMPIQKAVEKYESGKFKKWKAKKIFSTGYSNIAAYWFAFTMQNVSGRYAQMYWSIANQVDSAILFTTDTAGHLLSADTALAFTPLALRKIKIKRIAFNLQLKPGERQMYFMHVFYASHKAWYLPMWFDHMLLTDANVAVTLGIHVGIYLFVIVISLFLYLFFRKSIYLWYTVYITSFLFFVLIDEHMTIQFFDSTRLIKYLYDISPYPFIIFCLACNIRIMQLLCRQSVVNAIMYYPAKFFFWLNITVSIVYATSPFITQLMGSRAANSLIYFSINAIIPVSLIILVISVIELAIKKNSTALYYLIAIFCLCFGIVNYYFNNLGITNFVILNPNGLVVGITFEIATLTILIGKDYRQMKQERKNLLLEKKDRELNIAFNIIEIQEAERRRIAQDLHDDVGATLSTATLFLSEYIHQDVENNPVSPYLRDVSILISKANDDLRSVSHDLLPLDFSDKGLFDSLSHRIAQLNQKSGTYFDLMLSGNEALLTSNVRSISIYRMINELCNNIIKHARASSTTIQLIISSGSIQILAEDDGIGMDVNANKVGIGLKNIYARVEYLQGTVNIDSNSQGTTVMIQLPLNS